MRWDEFVASAPQLAAIGLERFEQSELVMLGTIRKDGSPRITPLEHFLFEGEFTIGGMWQSMKLLDLLREPRCALHSTTSNKDGTEGDFKLYGRAIPLDDREYRERYGVAVEQAMGWRPSEPYHLFRLDITSAGFVQFGKEAPAIVGRVQGERGVSARLIPIDDQSVSYAVVAWYPPQG